MSSVTDFMGKDHDRLDEIFREFIDIKGKDRDKAKALFSEFKVGLERHIVWEERILFPLFEGKTGMRDVGPTAVMRSEHGLIREFLEKIQRSVIDGGAGAGELEKGLADALGAHNDKEEHILYPWIDNSISREEREEAFVKMRNLPPEHHHEPGAAVRQDSV